MFSLHGSGFGAAPRIFLKALRAQKTVELAVKSAEDGTAVTQVPRSLVLDVYEVTVANGGATSAPARLNAPEAHHFDMPDAAPGTRLRVFGRNLYIGPLAPAAVFVDAASGAELKGVVTTSGSSPYALFVTPPAGVVAGRSYRVKVFNGYVWSAPSAATLLGRDRGPDPFAVGLPWAFDFAATAADGPGYKAGAAGAKKADHHVFNVKTDVALSVRAKGDGKANDAAAIQNAINLAAAYGGVVYLPPGVYDIGSASIDLKPGVVLRGYTAASSKIVYRATRPGFIIEPGSALTGFVDLTLQNQDASGATSNLSSYDQPFGKFIIQRVVWDLGTGGPISLKGDRIAILNSTFRQRVNYLTGDPAQRTGGIGPFRFASVTNVVLRNNTISWTTDQISFKDVTGALVENNRFVRSASDVIVAGPGQASWSWPFPYPPRPVAMGEKVSRVMGRQLSTNFVANLVIQNNAFSTSDGTILWNNNDGETILSEGGGPSPREEAGTIASVSGAQLLARPKCPGCGWRVYPGARLFVVSGAGAGQHRRVLSCDGDAFTLESPFDVAPAAGDRFSVAVPSLENAIIRNNTMSGNPFGVAMYHGAHLNVSVVANQLVDNGGIYLYPAQKAPSGAPREFNVALNIEINNNALRNTKGLFPSYVTVNFVMISENDFWGRSLYAIEARANQIVARKGTLALFSEEGFNHMTVYQNAGGGPFLGGSPSAMRGMVFQGDVCVNCPVAYRLNTGSVDTTIWNAVTSASAGSVSTFLSDLAIVPAVGKSKGTVVGKD
ncbi:glycosyl hydrolase family 28-related protein [Methylocella sp.]|uniref:glycosyl hydrolase family 28-related protein n=1 Tax=Methylocella sp. TaxID=1978226 RepID=UPI00378332E3